MVLRIASRKSDLARLQAYQVGNEFQKHFPDITVNYHFRESLGDINLNDPLWKMPEKGVFTEDFRDGLINGEFDLVVHSWKDLPIEQEAGTEIVATLPRADARDLLLFKKTHLEQVKQQKKLRVFSSSPRRIYNLTPFFKSFFPFGLDDVAFESVRGNILTRVSKMMNSDEVDGLIVAKAALDRLLSADQSEFAEGQQILKRFLNQCLWQVLPLQLNPTAAAQGALAIEIASGNLELKQQLKLLNCVATWDAVSVERDILKSYGGGCHQKIGVSCLKRNYGEVISLKGMTDSGEVLNKWKLNGQTQNSSPSELRTFNWFQREAVDYQMPTSKAHFIAKASALPKNRQLDAEIIWTSGLNTWQKLAQRGYWVNGSFESLGEQESMAIDALARVESWAKWTHQDAAKGRWQEKVATYKLLPLESAPDISQTKSFFWSSGSSFKLALQQYPQIINAQHYCGPGNTFEQLSQLLPKENLTIVLQTDFSDDDNGAKSTNKANTEQV